MSGRGLPRLASQGGRNCMYVAYILKSKYTPKTYVGITDNLERRLNQHNAGYHLYTKRYKPWYVAHKETFINRIEAHTKEVYWKSAAGRRWLKKNIFKNADVAELVYAQS